MNTKEKRLSNEIIFSQSKSINEKLASSKATSSQSESFSERNLAWTSFKLKETIK